MAKDKLIDAAESVVVELKRILSVPFERHVIGAVRNNINEAIVTLETALLDTDENPDAFENPLGNWHP